VPGNFQKTPAGLSLNRFARAKALDQQALQGLGLPCSVVSVAGSIVTVSFQVQAAPGATPITIPNAVMPVASAEYVRLPIQIGCKGVTVAAAAYLGGASGLGGGTATTARPANLTALAFLPLGNTGLFAVDGTKLTLYGEPGVRLQDKTGASFIDIEIAGITFVSNGSTLTLNSAGLTINGVLFATHEHTGVDMGDDNTGPVA
jgi:hypothetical protein